MFTKVVQGDLKTAKRNHVKILSVPYWIRQDEGIAF